LTDAFTQVGRVLDEKKREEISTAADIVLTSKEFRLKKSRKNSSINMFLLSFFSFLEPATSRLEVSRSIQLSYGAVCL
jgi:hypothetical protein